MAVSFRLGVVQGASDVLMVDGLGGRWLPGQRLSVQSVLEDGLHALEAHGPYVQRPPAGVFQTLLAVGLCQAHDAQHRAEALLGMGAGVHD
jgi:hypothetical protein